MLSYQKTSPSIVDPNQIVLGPHRIRRITSVEQDDPNPGAIKCNDDAIVNCILCGCEFERGEENASDLLRDVLVAKLLGLFLLLGGFSHGVAPKQGVRL